jgi:hypothetical protein
MRRFGAGSLQGGIHLKAGPFFTQQQLDELGMPKPAWGAAEKADGGCCQHIWRTAKLVSSR